MTWDAERAALCEAGRTLVEKGLVARTWGNLSIRVDDKHFLITPSGRTYETLGPNDIALVALDDLSWEGALKPSSEKELHARIYRVRGEVRAVVHTHQPAASALAAARTGFVPADAGDRERVGDEVPCAPYALPTTARLARTVEATATGSDCRAMLLSNHGTVCLGPDIEKALQVAIALEEAGERHVRAACGTAPAGAADSPGAAVNPGASVNPVADVERFAAVAREAVGPGGHVLVATTPCVVRASRAGRGVRPMLDDLAQIIGTNLPYARNEAAVRRYLGRRGFLRRSAVLVPGGACICAAKTEDDARAVAMVAEKGCRVASESACLGGGHAISAAESLLMRLIYLLKYSRRADA